MRLWLLAACLVLGLGELDAPGRSPEPPGGSAGQRAEPRFIPATHREGGRVVLPVVFPDGTRAELVHPRGLALARLGVAPYSSGTLQGQSPAPGRSDQVARDFVIRYGDVEDVVAGWTPLGRYPGSDGRAVGFWDSGAGESNPNYLAFQFGEWAVLVYDFPPEFDGGAASMTDVERATWARSFSGRETRRGFLRVVGTGPLRLAEAGEHAGPQLAFGSLSGPRWFALYPGRCRAGRHQDRRIHGRRVNWSRGFADWCASGSMRVHARGSRGFRRTLIRSLTVRDQTAPRR
jgi:hypothetical protein